MPRTGRPTADLGEKQKVLTDRGFKPEDLQPWYRKFHYHRNNANQNGKVTELTFEDYMQKVAEAGLTNPDQIGHRRDQFQLGRIGDTGPYTNESCRFITKLQNMQECRANGRYDPEKEVAAAATRSKEFLAIGPDNTVHHGHNLSEFCREQNLSRSSMTLVANCRYPSYNGWTVQYFEQDPPTSE
ncbi:hypothetical protein [Burkholderia phage FLC9]|nr:hypothetical protein [Burkholderia phage FLC9]